MKGPLGPHQELKLSKNKVKCVPKIEQQQQIKSCKISIRVGPKAPLKQVIAPLIKGPWPFICCTNWGAAPIVKQYKRGRRPLYYQVIWGRSPH